MAIFPQFRLVQQDINAASEIPTCLASTGDLHRTAEVGLLLPPPPLRLRLTPPLQRGWHAVAESDPVRPPTQPGSAGYRRESRACDVPALGQIGRFSAHWWLNLHAFGRCGVPSYSKIATRSCIRPSLAGISPLGHFSWFEAYPWHPIAGQRPQ